jgi:hypothetical protein
MLSLLPCLGSPRRRTSHSSGSARCKHGPCPESRVWQRPLLLLRLLLLKTLTCRWNSRELQTSCRPSQPPSSRSPGSDGDPELACAGLYGLGDAPLFPLHEKAIAIKEEYVRRKIDDCIALVEPAVGNGVNTPNNNKTPQVHSTAHSVLLRERDMAAKEGRKSEYHSRAIMDEFMGPARGGAWAALLLMPRASRACGTTRALVPSSLRGGSSQLRTGLWYLIRRPGLRCRLGRGPGGVMGGGLRSRRCGSRLRLRCGISSWGGVLQS